MRAASDALAAAACFFFLRAAIHCRDAAPLIYMRCFRHAAFAARYAAA